MSAGVLREHLLLPGDARIEGQLDNGFPTTCPLASAPALDQLFLDRFDQLRGELRVRRKVALLALPAVHHDLSVAVVVIGLEAGQLDKGGLRCFMHDCC